MPRLLIVLGILFCPVYPLHAHYHMLLPDKSSVKVGEEVILTFQLGHPFEHELFNTSKPLRAFAIAPDGKEIDLLNGIQETSAGQGDKKVTGFRIKYTPKERGDHRVVVHSAPHTIDGKKEEITDSVSVFIHVEAQKNWHRSSAKEAEALHLLPLTRPYGIRSGMVFRLAVETSKSPAKDVLVEIERYNSLPPKELPPDEFITYTTRTDAGGVAATTLPEPGWWGITAVGDKHRSTLWVYVADKIPTKPNE